MGRIAKGRKSKQDINKNQTDSLNKDHLDQSQQDDAADSARSDLADKENDGSNNEVNGDDKKKAKREEDTDGEVEFDAEGELDYNTPYVKELNKRLTRKRSSGNNHAHLESSEDEGFDNNEEKRGKTRGRPKQKTMSNKKAKGENEEENSDKKPPKKENKTSTIKKSKYLEKSANKKENKPKPARKSDKSKSTHDSSDESETDGKNYVVKKIVEMHTRRDGTREFLVRWEGYKPSEDTWEPEAHLDCPKLIEMFMAKVDKAKNASVKELRETRKPTFIPSLKINKPGGRNLRNAGTRPYYQE